MKQFLTTAFLISAFSVSVHSATWYDTLDPATADTDQGQLSNAFIFFDPITLPSGTVQRLRVYIGSASFDGQGFKVALYDNSLNLVISGNATINTSDSGTWKEITVSNTSISSGTYNIAWVADANATDIVYRYLNGSGVMHLAFAGGGYSGFPQNPLDGDAGSYHNACAVGVYIDTGGGGSPTPTATPTSTPAVLSANFFPFFHP